MSQRTDKRNAVVAMATNGGGAGKGGGETPIGWPHPRWVIMDEEGKAEYEAEMRELREGRCPAAQPVGAFPTGCSIAVDNDIKDQSPVACLSARPCCPDRASGDNGKGGEIMPSFEQLVKEVLKHPQFRAASTSMENKTEETVKTLLRTFQESLIPMIQKTVREEVAAQLKLSAPRQQPVLSRPIDDNVSLAHKYNRLIPPVEPDEQEEQNEKEEEDKEDEEEEEEEEDDDDDEEECSPAAKRARH